MKYTELLTLNEGIDYHLSKKLPFHESIFRMGSDEYFKLFRDARKLYVEGKLKDLHPYDEEILRDTLLGEWEQTRQGMVPLDMIIDEANHLKHLGEPTNEFTEHECEPGEYWCNESGQCKPIPPGYYVDDSGWLVKEDKYKPHMMYKGSKSDYRAFRPRTKKHHDRLMKTGYNHDDPETKRKEVALKTESEHSDRAGQIAADSVRGSTFSSKDDLESALSDALPDFPDKDYDRGKAVERAMEILYGELDDMISEAEYRGKKVPLNKPKRGGTKKFYVYTKNKKGNVIKVAFGADSGGGKLAVKLKDPKARKAFADRHNCDQKNDKTKAGYWSCRLPRYAKSLGLSGGGTWW